MNVVFLKSLQFFNNNNRNGKEGRVSYQSKSNGIQGRHCGHKMLLSQDVIPGTQFL